MATAPPVSTPKQLDRNLYTAIKSILNNLGYSNTQVVYANSNVLEPENTYCILNKISVSRAGRVDESATMPLANPILVYTNYYTLLLQVSFVGKEADELMFDFNDAVFSNRMCIEAFQKNNFGPMSKSDVRNIPQKRDTGWVEMWNVDLNLSYAIQSKQQQSDWVETFEVEDRVYL